MAIYAPLFHQRATSAMATSNIDINEMLDDLETTLLPRLFGHTAFRPGQREVFEKILSKKSCLAILPTGVVIDVIQVTFKHLISCNEHNYRGW